MLLSPDTEEDNSEEESEERADSSQNGCRVINWLFTQVNLSVSNDPVWPTNHEEVLQVEPDKNEWPIGLEVKGEEEWPPGISEGGVDSVLNEPRSFSFRPDRIVYCVEDRP